VPEFYLPLRALGSDFHAGMSGAVAAERVFAVLDAPPPVVARSVRRLPEGAPLEIACRGIVHTYPGALQPALAGLDLLWRPGECIAVVGASGAGKTTLLRALLRLLDPQSGAILVDGVPLQELDLDWWRRQIAYVPQEPTLFPGSVLENIRLGRGDASPEEVEAAAREARAQAFIEQLPRGYATPVGEGGRPLSGGQRQRLAIARALVRRAPLLILDEPTVRLDAEADRDVSLALRDLARGRRALIVAHRLSTAELADRIVVLAGGRVVEEGPPERLRRTGDLYPRLRRSYFRLSEVP